MEHRDRAGVFNALAEEKKKARKVTEERKTEESLDSWYPFEVKISHSLGDVFFAVSNADPRRL